MSDEIGEAPEYFQPHLFIVNVEGIEACRAVSCGPMKQTWDMISQGEGGSPTEVDKTPAKYHTEDFKISRAAAADSTFWDWHNAQKQGDKRKRAVSVDQLGGDGVTVIAHWDYPVCALKSFSGGEFDWNKSENIAEEIELSPVDMDRVVE